MTHEIRNVLIGAALVLALGLGVGYATDAIYSQEVE